MASDACPMELDALAARIPDGALLAVPPDYSNVPMAATHALIRRGAKDLNLLAVPISGFQADLLIGAGCVASLEAAAVSLGEYGPAPRFVEALQDGRLVMRDATCPAVHAALQASEKGVPFLPLRGIIGSDLLARRPDWRVVDNPFANDDPIVLLPAIRPDVALIHARWADREGNLWIGRRRELVTMAHAAAETFATVEAIHDGDLLADEVLAAGTLPALYVSGIALAERGAQPLGLEGCYAADEEQLAAYAAQARTRAGFAAYLDRYVFGATRAA